MRENDGWEELPKKTCTERKEKAHTLKERYTETRSLRTNSFDFDDSTEITMLL